MDISHYYVATVTKYFWDFPTENYDNYIKRNLWQLLFGYLFQANSFIFHKGENYNAKTAQNCIMEHFLY